MNTNVLVDFDTIIDTDFGLLKLLQEEYNNRKFISNKFLLMKDIILIHLLVNREDINPLYLAINGMQFDLDVLYNQFMDIEYRKILQNSIETNICDFINVLITNDNSISIYCKNLLEQQLIEKKFNGKVKTNKCTFINREINTIVTDDVSTIDISDYGSIIIKDFSKILNFKNLRLKDIYVANYKFNITDDVPLKDISMIISGINNIKLIDVYNTDRFVVPRG